MNWDRGGSSGEEEKDVSSQSSLEEVSGMAEDLRSEEDKIIGSRSSRWRTGRRVAERLTINHRVKCDRHTREFLLQSTASHSVKCKQNINVFVSILYPSSISSIIHLVFV